MLSKIKAVPQVLAALAVAAVLTFGATQAVAEDPCTDLPPHSCKYYPASGVHCPTYCGNNGYPFGGECLTGQDCCMCLEK